MVAGMYSAGFQVIFINYGAYICSDRASTVSTPGEALSQLSMNNRRKRVEELNHSATE